MLSPLLAGACQVMLIWLETNVVIGGNGVEGLLHGLIKISSEKAPSPTMFLD